MRVYVRSGKFRFFLLFPTRLLCSRGAVSIAAWALQKSKREIGLSKEDLQRAAQQILACKKNRKKIDLVEVVTAQGEKVTVRL